MFLCNCILQSIVRNCSLFFSRLEPSGETEEYLTKVEVKIKLPEELKFVLIDESEIILKHHKLPALPVQNTVDKILDDYVEAKSLGKSNDVRYSAIKNRQFSYCVKSYFANTYMLNFVLEKARWK